MPPSSITTSLSHRPLTTAQATSASFAPFVTPRSSGDARSVQHNSIQFNSRNSSNSSSRSGKRVQVSDFRFQAQSVTSGLRAFFTALINLANVRMSAVGALCAFGYVEKSSRFGQQMMQRCWDKLVTAACSLVLMCDKRCHSLLKLTACMYLTAASSGVGAMPRCATRPCWKDECKTNKQWVIINSNSSNNKTMTAAASVI